MNWTKLDPKEPAFKEEALFANAKGEWWAGEIEEIRQTSTGKVYIVSVGSEGNSTTEAKYFMRITSPKE